jgi:hypothetical protein
MQPMEILEAAWSFVSVKNNADAIAAISASIGVLVSAFGFALTYSQLKHTQHALRATNTYAIQKDARELMANVINDAGVIEYIQSGNVQITSKKPSQSLIRKAERHMGLIFQFYLSVYRQCISDGVTESLALSMASDFRDFMANKMATQYFQQQKLRGVYGDEHTKMVHYWHKKVP